jgi:RimJ/RimL family protein N-acetyltransferase
MDTDVRLRPVEEADLEVFFEHRLDPEANWLAAFTAADPSDREAFASFWKRILGDPAILARTVVVDSEVAGHVIKFEDEGRAEITYWLGRAFWNRGIGTEAVRRFLAEVFTERPVYARCAAGNEGSRRLLEKCGFRFLREERGYAEARKAEIVEYLFVLEGVPGDGPADPAPD